MSKSASKYDKMHQQLEEFRRRKALEKSARAERIQRRVQELHDKRRQTIVQIRSEIGIKFDEKGKLGTSVTEKCQPKTAAAVGKSAVGKPSQQGVKTFAIRAKQAAVQLKGVMKKFTNGSTKRLPDEKSGEVENEPTSVRRLTITLSDSFIQPPSVDAAPVAQKENTPAILPSVPLSKISAVKTVLKPLSSVGTNVNIKPISTKKQGMSGNFTKAPVIRKRVLLQSVGGPVAKKGKLEIVEPVAVDEVSDAETKKTINLTREQQLQLWRQKKQENQRLAEQKKSNLATERRKTISTMGNRAGVSDNVRARSGATTIDGLNITRRTLDSNFRSANQVVSKPASKLNGRAVIPGRSLAAFAVKHNTASVKVSIQKDKQIACGAGTSQRQSVGRRSLGFQQVTKLSNMQVKKPVEICSATPKIDSTARRSAVLPQTIDEKRKVLTVGPDLAKTRKIPGIAGPQVSTPYSQRRVTNTVQTPMYSCIQGPKVVSFRTPASAKRTPKTNQTPKLDEETCLREKLNKWLAARGKTPSRYRHLTCFGLHGHGHSHVQSAAKNTLQVSLRQRSSVMKEDSVQQLDLDMSVDVVEPSTTEAEIDVEETTDSPREQIANMIADCLILLHSGFPASHLMTWLNEVSISLPMAEQLTSFWTFKAELAMKVNGDDCQAAIAVLDEAIARNIENMDTEDIAKSRVLFERLEDKKTNISHNMSYGGNASYRLAAEIQQENAFNSSAVKLCVRKIKDPVTPLKSVATPVRRSTRKSYSTLPPSLRDHDVIVESVDEIAPEICATMTFKENVALNLEWRFN